MNIPKDRIIIEDQYQLIEIIADAIRHAESNKITSERLSEAHDYCQKYLMPEAWGKNVWHSILDDAIKMRDEIHHLKEKLV